MSIFNKKYRVDYCGRKLDYQNAKDKYCAGENVTLCFNMIATDTDYFFSLDGAKLYIDYDVSKGYILSFTMPKHDVVLHCSSKNSMLREIYI